MKKLKNTIFTISVSFFLLSSCSPKSSPQPIVDSTPDLIVDGQELFYPTFQRPAATEEKSKTSSPQITTPQSSTTPDLDEEPEWSADLLSVYREVRVKIFPHNSKFNAPHGKDTTINRVRLSSNGQCQLFAADRPTSEGGITRNQLIRSGNNFEMTTENLKSAVWLECNQPITLTRPDFLQNPIRYNGVMFIKPVSIQDTVNYITVVNVLDFEEYLRGVVPAEMPASWAAEALRAQAIAARTYAFYELATKVFLYDQNIMKENSGAQFDDTVTYQAYLGLKNTTAATDAAIAATAGQVMLHQGKIVKAYFHADSGGYTENAENVWGKYLPYILAKEEIYPEGSIPGSTWTYSPGFKEIEDKLIANKFLNTGQTLSDVRINKNDYYPSTRPSHIELVLSDRSVKRILAVDFSFAMRIKSPWIKITTNTANRSATFNGRGFGHGAGMNQWGARVMVDKFNKNHIDVLKFYYTGIDITAVRNN
jgi:stage II sporulation protein D